MRFKDAVSFIEVVYRSCSVQKSVVVSIVVGALCTISPLGTPIARLVLWRLSAIQPLQMSADFPTQRKLKEIKKEGHTHEKHRGVCSFERPRSRRNRSGRAYV